MKKAKVVKYLCLSSILLGLSVFIGVMSYNTWNANHIKKGKLKFYYNGEYYGKSKRDLIDLPSKFTEVDLENKKYFVLPWHENKEQLLSKMFFPHYYEHYSYDTTLKSYSTSIEDLFYAFTYKDRKTIAPYFNVDDTGQYKMAGFPSEIHFYPTRFDSRWVILYDFMDTIGKDTGIVHSQLMYMSDTNEHYSEILTEASDCDNTYLELLNDNDVCYNIDFRYNRFDTQVSEFIYNDEFVTEDIINIYQEILKRNLKDYNYYAQLALNYCIDNKLGYKDSFTLEDC